ncbi:hypothetical protein [Streptomyces sp. NPDC053048]|uniref:hypothetical protein n=1 Tax=Streptomyces sp. NPDC053048 TaxID=3365694 RepID=UPI0037D70281
MITILMAGLELGALTAVAWAVNGRLMPVTDQLSHARLAPAPPYAGFDLTNVYAVRYLACGPCGRLHMPHEIDDQAGTARCAECQVTRSLTSQEAAS